MGNIDNFSNDKEHDYLTDNEESQLIGTIYDSLILENIFDQIRNPITPGEKIDYFSLFRDRINYLLGRYKENYNFIENLKFTRDTFYKKIFVELVKTYGISYHNPDNDSSEEFESLIYSLYHFFVLDYKENIENFFLNFIKEHKKTLSSLFVDKKTKDSKMKFIKDTFKNKYDVIMIYHVRSVVDSILSDELTAREIINFSLKDNIDSVDNMRIYKLFFEEEVLTSGDDFRNKFFNIFLKREDGYYEIILDLETKLVESCPKNEPGESNEEE